MDKQTYTEWFKGLNARLAAGEATQEQYEMIVVHNQRSLLAKLYNTRYDLDGPSLEERMDLINHFFELILDAEISDKNALVIIRSVASNIQKLPAAKAFVEKHNVPVPSLSEILGERPGLLRKRVLSTTDKMIGRPVITEVNKTDNEVTIELPWKTALHVYRGFLVKHLMAKHGYSFNDAYLCIDEHLDKYNSILADCLESIIAHKESHLVSVGGGITAAGTGLVVSGVIKPEE